MNETTDLYAHAPQSAAARKAAAEAAAVERQLVLGAWPALYSGESEELRLARAAAYDRCWGALAGSIQVRRRSCGAVCRTAVLRLGASTCAPARVLGPSPRTPASLPHTHTHTHRLAAHTHPQETLEGADAGVFRGLLDLARASHVPPGSAAAAAAAAGPEFAAGCQRLPTGLVLAGGVNSADHCRTFPHLAAFLRQHGCYVALLQPASLGRSAGDALGEVLRQWSGLGASKAEHVEALAAWYADETGAGLEAAAPAAQQQTEQQRRQQGEEDESGGDEDEDAADGGEECVAGRVVAGRLLRQRPAAGAAAAGPSDAQLAARQRPLLVVVEGTECVDLQALRDFITLTSEVRGGWGWGWGWSCGLLQGRGVGVAYAPAAVDFVWAASSWHLWQRGGTAGKRSLARTVLRFARSQPLPPAAGAARAGLPLVLGLTSTAAFNNHNHSCPEPSLQARHALPLTLVLGLTTTAGALSSLLPSQAIDRCLHLHHFRLVSSCRRCTSCWLAVFGCGQFGCAAGPCKLPAHALRPAGARGGRALAQRACWARVLQRRSRPRAGPRAPPLARWARPSHSNVCTTHPLPL